MNTLIETLINAAEDLYRIQNEAQLKMREIVAPALCEIVRENSSILEAISWTQYSPYFNDGEACVFSVNELKVRFKSEAFPEDVREELDELGDYEDGWVELSCVGSYFTGYHKTWGDRAWVGPDLIIPDELKQSIKDLAAQLEPASTLLQSNALESTLESLFGNHVRVTVTENGITTDDYDHD